MKIKESNLSNHDMIILLGPLQLLRISDRRGGAKVVEFL